MYSYELLINPNKKFLGEDLFYKKKLKLQKF